jgi:hypothetical protein
MKMNKILEKIKFELERIAREKFTGPIVVRLFFNQGGIRDCKLIREEDL